MAYEKASICIDILAEKLKSKLWTSICVYNFYVMLFIQLVTTLKLFPKKTFRGVFYQMSTRINRHLNVSVWLTDETNESEVGETRVNTGTADARELAHFPVYTPGMLSVRFTKYCHNHQIKKNEKSRARSAYGECDIFFGKLWKQRAWRNSIGKQRGRLEQ
jgi:hypothetical protein